MPTKSSDVSGARRITIAVPHTLTIGKGEGVLTATGDSSPLEALSVSLSGDTLLIDSGHFAGALSIDIRLEELIELTIKVPAEVSVGPYKSEDQMTIATDGGATLRLRQVDVTTLRIHANGPEQVEASGAATNMFLTIEESAEFSAKDLRVTSADVTVKGAGKAEINVSNTLKVVISGAGEVGLWGNPAITKLVSPAGELKRLG